MGIVFLAVESLKRKLKMGSLCNPFTPHVACILYVSRQAGMHAGRKTSRQSDKQAGRQAGMCVFPCMYRQLIPFISQLVGKWVVDGVMHGT